jgi:hypothetical protein
MAEDEPKSKVQKFRALSAPDKWLFLRAVWWLLVARVMLSVVPFDRLISRLSSTDWAIQSPPDRDFLERIGFAVAAAAANVPWRSDCFPQTIAAHKLLRRAGIASIIHFGVEREGEGALNGHAWLTCGDTVVTGDGELERYTEIHQVKT